MKASSSPGDSTGFTLVEILVALLILGVSLAVLLRSFSDGLTSLDRSAFHALALAEAKSQIDRIGTEVPLEDGELSGVSEGGLSWVVRMRRNDRWHQGLSDRSDGAHAIPHDIEIAVTDRAGRMLVITTSRLAAAE